MEKTECRESYLTYPLVRTGAYYKKLILKKGAIGLFKKGTKEEVIEIIPFHLLEFYRVKDKESFDELFDNNIAELHQQIYPFYRDDLKVTADNPYTYTARLYTQLHKIATINYQFSGIGDPERLYGFLHPVISNAFIKSYLTAIKSVTDIKGKDQYYDIVGYYRYLIKQDLNKENENLLTLMKGFDV